MFTNLAFSDLGNMALTNRAGGRVLLSERLRNMRFMRERGETDFRAKLEKEQREREKSAHWTLETEGDDVEDDRTPLVIVEDSLAMPDMISCVGRQSFGKFNTVIEKRNRPGSPKEEAKATSRDEIKLSSKEVKHFVKMEASVSNGESRLSFKSEDVPIPSKFRIPLNSGKRSFKGPSPSSRKRSRRNNSGINRSQNR